MNKVEIEAKIAQECEMTHAEAKRVLACVLNSIEGSLKEGAQVKLVGFGSFTAVETKERKVKSPADGCEIIVPAAKRVKFKPGKGLKDSLNS